MILEISVLIIAIFVVISVIGLLIALFQILKTAKEAERLLDTVRQQIVPLSHDFTIILNDSQKIVQSVERQIGKVEVGVDAIKDTAQKIKNFEAEIENRIAQPFVEIVALFSALSKLYRGIVEYFKKDRT